MNFLNQLFFLLVILLLDEDQDLYINQTTHEVLPIHVLTRNTFLFT